EGVTSPAYTDSTVVNGVTYYYSVTAVNAGGESASSNQVSATPMAVPPAAPSGLTASGAKRKIVLGWQESSGAKSYRVKRSTTSAGPYGTITELTQASYTDTNVQRGVTYYYVVTAVNEAGESASSNQAKASAR